MPIYECYCGTCKITFEILAPVTEANRKRPCPRCARQASRVASAFAIGSGKPVGGGVSTDAAGPPMSPGNSHAGHAHHGNSRNGRAGRPTVPDFARLCWMDDRSAERFAAYKLGQGAEYDDKSAAREDLRKKRGLPPVPSPDTSHSPVAAMVARKKAAQAKKGVKSLKNGAPDTTSH